MSTEGGPAAADLNQQQREAIDHDRGPLIVLAGPGTGKTRVITGRVARLIDGGAAPESIVAMTFTVKAARELRERLRGLVGGSAADRVNAHTFHGFGRRLIARFGDYLGLRRGPRLIDSAEMRRLARGLVREHDLFLDLVASGRDGAISGALAIMGALANNAVLPGPAVVFAQEWGERVARNETGLEQEALAAEQERQRRFAGVAELYRLFAAACAEKGWATFDDLILWPIRLLREREAAASIVRDDYRHVVVDEFQDVNRAQIELLHLLCPARAARGGEAPDGPDLCVVGDDDQSIYEFRGADDRAFAHFEQIWPGARVVSLSQNYRSERPIIDAANAIMARAETRFAPKKVVELPEERRQASPAEGAGVECLTLDEDGDAGDVIAAMILADRKAAPGRAWADYAVIARTHTDLDRIGSALRMEGIPVRLARGSTALLDLGVQDVLRWIELLASAPADDAATYAAHWLLTRPPHSVAPEVMAEWAQAYKAERSRHRLGGDNGVEAGFSKWLLARHSDDARGSAAIQRFCALECELRREACHRTADAAIFEIIRRADVAHAELLEGRERAKRVGHLSQMVRFASSRLEALDPPADLASFWSYYQDLSEEERSFREQGEDRIDGDSESAEEGAEAVSLLTAHSAKGLEFDTVFVPRVRPGHGYPKTSGGDNEELPPGLLDRAGDDRSVKERQQAEERRIFYVACTRAERRLVVLAKKKKSRGKSTDFFQELTLDPPCAGFVTRRDGADVLGEAARLGVKLCSRSAVDEAGADLGVANRVELIRRARQEARLAAAQGLDSVDRPDVKLHELEEAAVCLRQASERVALAAHLGEHGKLPEWIGRASAPVRAYAERLAETFAAGRGDRPFAAELFRPIPAPLPLSFSWVKEYHDCPRCFYLKRVMGVPEPQGKEQLVGTAVHNALAAFYQQQRAAEAEGRGRPTLEDLLRFGREEFLAALPARNVADEEQLRQALAQLKLTHEKLYNPRDEVEQVEFVIRFPYQHEGIAHTCMAKIDRLDRMPAPARGHRIVDYKTGQPWKKLTEPQGDDLQLGMYAMGLRWHQDGGGDGAQESDLLKAAEGAAEYWLLSTGERGTIDLADIEYQTIKERIDDAVKGILAGDFPVGDGCWQLCRMFARD
jgi:superfamily I DNA/RNA helicase